MLQGAGQSSTTSLSEIITILGSVASIVSLLLLIFRWRWVTAAWSFLVKIPHKVYVAIVAFLLRAYIAVAVFFLRPVVNAIIAESKLIPISPESVSVNLSAAYNRIGISMDGMTFSQTSSLDNCRASYSANLLGSTRIWNDAVFNLGPPNAPDAISSTGNTVLLPSSGFSSLMMLAAGVNGNQAAQTFSVNYRDGTTASFTQSLSDWMTPQGYSGESKAVTMAYRDCCDGTQDKYPFYLYGYAFGLNSAKTVASITLPNNSNVVVLALTLVP